jgi:hypothetical protein
VDPSCFDAWSKHVAAGDWTRRRLNHAILSGVLLPLGGSVLPPLAALTGAKKKKKKCKRGTTRCGKTCVNLKTDARNCGSCGTVCGARSGRPDCVRGVCTAKACPHTANSCDPELRVF